MSKTNIPQKVIDLIKELEMTKDETLWDCHGTWVMYHKALEKIAAHKGVTFDEPKIIHSDVASKSVVVLVTGRMEKRSEWSFGEATPANNKNAYPFAMSEKRAKDRVILKLVGLHGDVYSDTEIDKQAQDDIKSRVNKKEKEDPSKDINDKDNNDLGEETKPNPKVDWTLYISKQQENIRNMRSLTALSSWTVNEKKNLVDLAAADKAKWTALFNFWSARNEEIKNG